MQAHPGRFFIVRIFNLLHYIITEMIIRPFVTSDIGQINIITHSLHPKWFDKKALVNIPKDIQTAKTYVAEINNEVLGFISYYAQDGVARISWMGVKPDKHRLGIGRKLVETIEKELKEIGVTSLTVETVVKQEPFDGSYDLTMKFYRALGFSINKKYKKEQFEQFTFYMGMLKKKI